MPRLVLLALLLVLSSCTRRFYAPMDFQPAERPRVPLEWSGVALLPDGLVVAASEQHPLVVFEVAPVVGEDGITRSINPRGGDVDGLFRWTDGSARCPESGGTATRCRRNNYRARVEVQPMPVDWSTGVDGSPRVPRHVEALSPYACAPEEVCGPRVLGVTEFSTVARVTEFRSDTVDASRDETERLFVLERADDRWVEVPVPAVDRLRQQLSDWGRANCGEDLVIEGVAFRPDDRTVFLGLNRCKGPAREVLAYSLGEDERGGAATISVYASGILDVYGADVAGPSEGLSGLDWAYGHLWASSSWNDYGYSDNPQYGGRLLVVRGDHLEPVPLPSPLSDRSDAVAILPNPAIPRDLDATDPRALFPYVNALALFDNDEAAKTRPTGTVLRGYTPAPTSGHAELLELSPSPFGDLPLGLNGFDFQWWVRDHRVGTMSAIVDDRGDPGAWTSALGGMWQVRLGAMGRALRSTGKAVGHNRQAVELTDYGNASELQFTSYKAVLSVVPRERLDSDASIARVLDEVRYDYEVIAELPLTAREDAGLVLQGFAIDASPRAAGGICVAGLDVDTDWAEPADPETGAVGPRRWVKLRAAVLGGLCNDFNAQGRDEYHGVTTDSTQGVKVTLYFAVVEGARARRGTLLAAQRDRPGTRTLPTHAVWAEGDHPPLAPYRRPPNADRPLRDSPTRIGNRSSKDNMACLALDPVARRVDVLPLAHTRHAPAPDAVEWMGDAVGFTPRSDEAAGSLSGFTYALDLRGFDPGLWPEGYADVSERQARDQNLYIYRYLLRAWLEPDDDVFLEGGITHGIHLRGLGQDNAQPTALLVEARMTWWDDLSAQPQAWLGAPANPRRRDPNLQPEDGYTRWALTSATDDRERACSSH